MKNFLFFILCILFLFMLTKIKLEESKIIKKLEDLNSTLEYIDNRMDTLEFFRIPEKKK
jgi:hypothetical protein